MSKIIGNPNVEIVSIGNVGEQPCVLQNIEKKFTKPDEELHDKMMAELDAPKYIDLFNYQAEDDVGKAPPIAFSDEVLENPEKHDLNTYLFHALPIDVGLREEYFNEIMEEYKNAKENPKCKKVNGKIILE